ncbi:MAG TPA: type IV secretion system DNA-binding domain-containing protein, partial [Xanthomonadales bacterium]|nr:type IV secretion system DNA-binding domain-containing protein [Xanthomonadales bacterium]
MARGTNIEQRHELPITQQIIDPRPATEKFAEWLTDLSNFYSVVTPVALLTVLAPVLALVTLPMLLFAALAYINGKCLLPVRYPLGTKDENGKPGQGILYIGEVASKSQFENFKEIWLSDDDLRKHMLILGSTGSGKSEALKSIFYNALNWSSGFFIADGKADNKLPTDVYTMVRSNGRDADMLVLNFLLAGKTPEQVRTSRTRRSNKLNPFPSADADTIIQMGANLLPRVEGDAKNWQEKALNLWRSIVAALCYKRDTEGMELSVATFIDYMALHKVEELYIDGFNEARHRGGEWSYGYAGIKNYLESGCPAYSVQKLLAKHDLVDSPMPAPAPGSRTGAGAATGKTGKQFEQDSMAGEQHSYRTNQLMPVLNLLDKTYGFIFRDKFSEIDMTDVTLRNRILVMLIPSLEKSAAEAENLGKLAIACLRVMMSKNLGAEVEGSHEDLLGSKATNSPYPYVVALDELAYYFSDGIAVMFAQARSLGTCMIAAAQDLEKLTEGSKSAEAGAMLANQVTKFFMRIDDTGKTAEMVQKVVGKAQVAVRKSFRYNQMGYARKNDVDVVEADRVSTQMLQAFKQGEGVVNALGKTSFMRWFYMGKDIEEHRVDSYHVNRFLQVASPTAEDVAANSIPVDDFNDPYRKGRDLKRRLSGEINAQVFVDHDPVIAAIAEAQDKLNPHLPAEERMICLYQAARAAVIGATRPQSSEKAQAPQAQSPGQQAQPAATPAPSAAASPAPAHTEREAMPTSSTDGAGDDEDVLAFLSSTPFERRPAAAVLGFDDPPSPTDADAREAAAVAAVGLDPFDALLRAGKTLKLEKQAAFRGELLRRLIGAPQARNPDTGLPIDSHDDWIGQALK